LTKSLFNHQNRLRYSVS